MGQGSPSQAALLLWHAKADVQMRSADTCCWPRVLLLVASAAGCLAAPHRPTPWHPTHLHRLAGQLRYQPVSFAVTAAPPVLLAHGESVQFTGGTPLLMWAPEVPGFERRPGETVVITGAFPCEASLRCAMQKAALGACRTEGRAGTCPPCQQQGRPLFGKQAAIGHEWRTPVCSSHSCCSCRTVPQTIAFPCPFSALISGPRPESASSPGGCKSWQTSAQAAASAQPSPIASVRALQRFVCTPKHRCAVPCLITL